jgi:hypothetical protein
MRTLPRAIRWQIAAVLHDIWQIQSDKELDLLIMTLGVELQRRRGEPLNELKQNILAEAQEDLDRTFYTMKIENDQELEDLIAILHSLSRTGEWKAYR